MELLEPTFAQVRVRLTPPIDKPRGDPRNHDYPKVTGQEKPFHIHILGRQFGNLKASLSSPLNVTEKNPETAH